MGQLAASPVATTIQSAEVASGRRMPGMDNPARHLLVVALTVAMAIAAVRPAVACGVVAKPARRVAYSCRDGLVALMPVCADAIST